uniref:Major facilitator superfamily (MFS) profile domain-containing protein n=1 Tax=Capitella teleta TaxID=283909 RepID=X2ATU3_CAPTE
MVTVIHDPLGSSDLILRIQIQSLTEIGPDSTFVTGGTQVMGAKSITQECVCEISKWEISAGVLTEFYQKPCLQSGGRSICWRRLSAALQVAHPQRISVMSDTMSDESSTTLILPKMEVNQAADQSGRFWGRYDKRMWLGSLFMGSMMLYASRTAMPLCTMAISSELGWDKTDTGSVLSAFFWGYTMTQILGGYLSDRIGGDKLLMSGAMGWTILTFWTPQIIRWSSTKSTALALIVISRVLVGCFQGLLGMTWLLYLRYYMVAKDRKRALVLSMKDNVTSQLPRDQIKVPWGILFTKPAFWAVVIGHFCNNNAYFILLSWLPTYFEENFPDEKGWVFNVVPWLVAIPMQWFAGWAADHLLSKGLSTTFVRKLMQSISFGGVSFFLFMISYTSSYGGALFCMASALACGSFHSAGILVNPQDIAPKYAGSVFGLMNTAGAIPGFIGVYVAGYILQSTQSWAAVFNQTALVCLVGCRLKIGTLSACLMLIGKELNMVGPATLKAEFLIKDERVNGTVKKFWLLERR